MPHITVDGYHSDRSIRKISLHAEIEFSEKLFCKSLYMRELQEKMNALVAAYFDSIESETYTNKEWNEMVNNE